MMRAIIIVVTVAVLWPATASAAKCGRMDRSTGRISTVACPEEVRQQARRFQAGPARHRRSVDSGGRGVRRAALQEVSDSDHHPAIADTLARRTGPARVLAGVSPELAALAARLSAACGASVISGLRHTYVAGTRRLSCHASGRAIDVRGNPSCVYGLLRGWPGGVSTDYGRVRHVHVSLGCREDGMRFRHGRSKRSVARSRGRV